MASTALLALSTFAPAQTPTEIQRTPPPGQRIPQQRVPTTGALQGILLDENGRPLPGVRVQLIPPQPATLGISLLNSKL